MARNVTIILLFVSFIVMTSTHSLKGEVQILERNISNLDKRILKKQGAIKALKAEWNHLNSPDRLEKLNRQYLNLTRILPGSVHIEKNFSFADIFREKQIAQK